MTAREQMSEAQVKAQKQHAYVQNQHGQGKPQQHKTEKESGGGRNVSFERPEALGSEQGDSKESDSGSKVVCTELVEQGLMSERARKACTLYAHRHLGERFMDGYHFWAVPYVRLMRRSKRATDVIKPFVKYRTTEVAYRLGLQKKGSVIGKVICALHDPLCRFLGYFVGKTQYQSLYVHEVH